MKASLYDWASKESHTEVESYLADFQQIADLLVVDKNLALEVQCSLLSLERFLRREAMRIEPTVTRSIVTW